MKLICSFAREAGKLTPSFRSPRSSSSPPPPPPPPVISRNPSPYLDFRSALILKFILIALVLLAAALPAHAATITVGANCTFKQAWDSAFDDSAPTGSGCTAGSGNDTIELQADAVLGAKIWEGSAGSGTLTVNGNGHAIRGDGTYSFFGLWGAPTITFNNITFTGAAGGDRENGGAFNPYTGAGTYTFNDCVFHNNTALKVVGGSGGFGGAISAGADTTITINRCAFYNNRAKLEGGAIYTDGAITVNNSSFFNNRAENSGGAIYLADTTGSKTVRLRHVTMTNNQASATHGALNMNRGAGVQILNSILYGNSPTDCRRVDQREDAATTPAELNNNKLNSNAGSIIGTSNCDFVNNAVGNTAVTDNPQLVGPTTHNLGSFYIPRLGSPAIDAVTCLAANVGGNIDQRGQARPKPAGENDKCDRGAIEHTGYVPPPPQVTTPRTDVSPPPGDDVGSGGGGGGDDDEDEDEDEDESVGMAPPVSTCLTLDGIAAYNLSPSTQCQRVNALQIANPDIKDGDFVDAVDVWSWVMPNTQICFEASGGGAFKFIDTAAMPRTVQAWAACSLNGMTCGAINGPGMLVLLPGDPPAACAAAPAAQAAQISAQALSNCMVRTQFNLNFRDAPDGEITGGVPHNATLTALQRTAGWFKVDYHGERGWISAEFVETKGTCG